MSTVNYFVTKIKRANKPKSNAITNLYCQVAEEDGKKMGSGTYLTREEVIKQIEVDNLIFKTATKKEGTTYLIGGKIEVVEIKSIKYLRTDGNKTEEDNLGNLPEE